LFTSVFNQLDAQNFLSQPVHETATYGCDDTRGCVMQFCSPDYEHMCSKHVEAYNKLIVKQILCIKLVKYWDKYTQMHSQQNVKKCAKIGYQSKSDHPFCKPMRLTLTLICFVLQSSVLTSWRPDVLASWRPGVLTSWLPDVLTSWRPKHADFIIKTDNCANLSRFDGILSTGSLSINTISHCRCHWWEFKGDRKASRLQGRASLLWGCYKAGQSL